MQVGAMPLMCCELATTGYVANSAAYSSRSAFF